MTIRVTQQYVDVFGAVDGNLVVGRQFVEVLHDVAAGAVEESASNTISFAQVAHGIAEQDASSTMNLSDVASAAMDVTASASSTMALTQSLVKSALGIASNVMTLADFNFNFNYVADRQVPENVLAFTQTAQAGGNESTEDVMALTQVLTFAGPRPVITSSQLTFDQVARNSCHNMRLSQTLGIVDDARVPLATQNVTSTMNLVDVASMSFINDVIAFVQTAVGGKSPGAQTHTIAFVQTVLQGGTFRRTISQDLGIGHALTYFDDTACNRKSYTPFMGEGATGAPPESLTDPQFDTSPGDADRFLLYWPARGARDTTVSIRAPQFSNRDRNAYTRVNRETRGGRLVVFADPNWPQIRTMAVTVTGLLKTEVDAVKALFYAKLGQIIGLTDWYGHEWEGIILDPEEPAVQDSKEKWTITFKFEGQIIEGFSPGHNLGVSDAAPVAKDPGANDALELTQTLGGSWPTPTPGDGLGLISQASATVESP